MIHKLTTKLEFGKHKGKTVQEIIDEGEGSYLAWAIDTIKEFKLDIEAERALEIDQYYDYYDDEYYNI